MARRCITTLKVNFNVVWNNTQIWNPCVMQPGVECEGWVVFLMIWLLLNPPAVQEQVAPAVLMNAADTSLPCVVDRVSIDCGSTVNVNEWMSENSRYLWFLSLPGSFWKLFLIIGDVEWELAKSERNFNCHRLLFAKWYWKGLFFVVTTDFKGCQEGYKH